MKSLECFQGLVNGFGIAFSLTNLTFALVGALLGTIVGILPGLGPAATISLFTSLSFKIGSPVTSIIMMAGIFYGAMYGGSTTSILVNIPGEAASVVTCIDGYQMALKGRAGPALGIAAIGSFYRRNHRNHRPNLCGTPFGRICFEVWTS